MIPSLKFRRLTVKEHFNIIFCRHILTILTLTSAFGAFAFLTQKDIPLTTFAGLLLSIILSYLLESLDTTLKTPEDIELCAKMSYLGYIPSIEKELKNSKDADLVSDNRHYSYVAEAFRKAVTSLLSSCSEEKQSKTFVVSSFIPKEGKSFVATNLAITFASAGEPTLLIDGDMRKGRLDEVFNVGNEKGLSNVLAGVASFQESVTSTNIENLSLLSSGVASPNPIELLKAEKLKTILQEAGTKFKKIVIDTPPVLSVPDALVFGGGCDGLIFVIKAGVTPFQHIVDAQKIIGDRVKVLGAVLNGVDVKKTQQ